MRLLRSVLMDGLLSAPDKSIGESIGLALDRRVEYLGGVRIVLVGQHGDFRIQHKPCCFHLLANSCRVDSMQRLGATCARSTGGNVVNDDVEPTRLEPLIDGSIERSRSCASRLDEGRMEVVVEQV